MDSNLTKLMYAVETTYGVIPASPPSMTEIPFTSCSLVHNKATAVSEEIRGDRARSEVIEVGKGVSGSLGTELLVGTYDDLLRGALMVSSWISGTDNVTVSANHTTGVITVTSGTLSVNARAAGWVKISGFASGGNNGIKRVVASSPTSLTVEGLVASESGVSVSIQYRYARPGTALVSFLLQEVFAGMSPVQYAVFPGLVVNQWQLELTPNSRATQSFDMLGTRAQVSSTRFDDGMPTALPTRKPCNTATNVGGVIIGSGNVNTLNFRMTLNNNLRERRVVGREWTLAPGMGTAEVTVSAEVYFESASLLQSFLSHVYTSIKVPVIDPEGNLLGISIPRAAITGGYPQIGGVNTDIVLPLEFTAVVGADKYVIQVDRLNA
jgi:hypothetical protein